MNLRWVDAGLTCALFQATSNPNPPRRFTSTSWGRFKRSKEYRSIVRIPRIDYTCSDGRIIKLDRKPTVEQSKGYTPTIRIRKGGGILRFSPLDGFVAAERYTQRSLGFNASKPRVTWSPGDRVVNVMYFQASRLTKFFRALTFYGVKAGGITWVRLRFDAPFIWTFVHERLTCRGAGVRITSSSIPSRVMYLNNNRVIKSPQSRNLADFLRAGGRRLNPKGRGKLDFNCRRTRRVFWGGVQFPRNKASCLKEIPGW
jgi:hypothetical protein